MGVYMGESVGRGLETRIETMREKGVKIQQRKWEWSQAPYDRKMERG